MKVEQSGFKREVEIAGKSHHQMIYSRRRQRGGYGHSAIGIPRQRTLQLATSEEKSVHMATKEESSEGTSSTKSTTCGKFPSVDPDDDITGFRDRVEQFFIAQSTPENKQVATLIANIPPDMYANLKKLSYPELPSKKSLQELLKMLENHYKKKSNIRAERYKFHKAVQEEGESISDYILRLRGLAETCDFGQYIPTSTGDAGKLKQLAFEDSLCDRFTSGLRSEYIQTRLIAEGHTSFAKMCDFALNLEMAFNEEKVIHGNGSEQKVSHVGRSRARGKQPKKPEKKRSQSRREDKPQCRRCGRYSHDPEQCPAKNWTCFVCNKKGHTSVVCRNKDKQKPIKELSGGSPPTITVPMKIEGQEITVEVDSGAGPSLISSRDYKGRFGYLDLKSCNLKLRSFTAQSIKVVGKIEVQVETPAKTARLPFIVVETADNFTPLVGRNWLDTISPNWRLKFFGDLSVSQGGAINVATEDFYNEIKRKFPFVLSSDPNQAIVGFKADVRLEQCHPIFHGAYEVPFRLKPAADKEFDRLVQVKTLEKVEFSRWASPVVIVPKPNDEVRICLDGSVTINPHVKMQHYPLSKIEDIFASLSNCRIFVILDLRWAYLQLELEEHSREYLTINTHRGLFRYNRLPFGVSSAVAIFQSVMERMLVGIEGVRAFLDDIIIGGKNEEECRQRLFQVLEKFNTHRVQINFAKSNFFADSVEYLGHILSYNQIKPNPKKIEAIVKAPAPTNVKELQAFLGLLNYYRRFIPDLSGKLTCLYHLLKQGEKFVWSDECQKVFEESKKLLTKDTVLELFDPEKEIVLTTDASPYGVSAVLSHVVDGIEKPVIFISSVLSDAEKNYSQLHREALAVVFACKKLFKYLYGKPFTIHTDSQALKEIFNPSKGTPPVAAARLQRWAVQLSVFNYKIVHKSAKKIENADALSRLPISESTEVEEFHINVIKIVESVRLKFSTVVEAYRNDSVLNKLYKFVMWGWPQEVPEDLKPFYRVRNSLSTENEAVFYGNRLVIPCKLRLKVLQILHENHNGIVLMKKQARAFVWWPKIDDSIEAFVSGCEACQKTQNVPREVVTTKWKETQIPFERIHLDFFHFSGKEFLILVDSFSKYIDVFYMSSTSAKAVSDKLENFFKIFGFPTTIVTDNGPPFGSNGFKKFCEERDIALLHSPAYHPQSNGLAERGVQTEEKSVEKISHCLLPNENLCDIREQFRGEKSSDYWELLSNIWPYL
ncbi:uncharacterized protein K02A2.6-like [Phlebotomus papatasi]|uniref:uncharacterized protein K02A2.6-like n=1 Tax=Phlebotomus papatasi TaxID=29031 RepID=UPI0024842CB0|nr:uncharacterized protein K02A2.6-like [Phlebotomus papatasi]